MTTGEAEDSEELVRSIASAWWSTMRGEPTPDERRRFEAWCAEDPRHMAAYDRIVRRWAQTEPTRSTQAAADRTLTPSSLAERRPYVFWGGVTAVAAVALGVVAIETDLVGRYDFSGTVRRYAATTTQRSIALADNSKVVLAAGASLTSAVSSTARRVRLQAGTGRFDIFHDAGRPFTVETPNGSITVRGTMFDVTVAGSMTRVSLIRGSVVVRGLGPDTRPVLLRPGERAVVERDRPARRVVQAGPASAPNMVVLDDVPLATAIRRVAGDGASRVAISPGIRSDLKVTGAFRVGDVDGLARAAAGLFGLRLGRTGDGQLLLSPD